MKHLMVCENEKCPFEGEKPYSTCIAEEAILDENNMAAAYCPHCQSPLVHKLEPATCGSE